MSLSWHAVRQSAKGREYSFISGILGIDLTWISRLIVFRDGVFGSSFMGVQGFWIEWGKKQAPKPQLTQVPLTVLFLVWYVRMCLY